MGIVESTHKPSSQLLPIFKAPTKPWKSGHNDGGMRKMAWVMDMERELKLQSENIAAVKRRLDESVIEANVEWTSLMERVEEQVDSLSSLTTVLLHSMQQLHAHATTTPGKDVHAYPESVGKKAPHTPHIEKRRTVISANDLRAMNEKDENSLQIQKRQPIVTVKDIQAKREKADDSPQIEK